MDSSPTGSSVHGISQQECWGGSPFPSPGDLPDSEIKLVSPALAGEFFTTESPGKSSKNDTDWFYSKYGWKLSSINITWELAKTVNYQTPHRCAELEFLRMGPRGLFCNKLSDTYSCRHLRSSDENHAWFVFHSWFTNNKTCKS